ncbi:hypothetical protein [Bacillus thuringiensis]|uniref:hypothetical protein n=1 Tax=Bacillus thuringiensis TaxID=1428 RepID=UPI0005B73DB4|nr:hypothetical protein [Bacillus thuringiensis]MEC2862059.1 hypothetical protein [Bacillus cereus]KIP29277.1 hypothetical protein BG10_3574 [Bacillus thuringiensis serovar morrisoni]MCT6948514.1 hypothetical protein [Bacillus thuringiensis]MED2079256.1 hypothetical protein [Bacillus thuringiensis]MEE2016037.1 hypothetical protein [Bacillus thuringiensis]
MGSQFENTISITEKGKASTVIKATDDGKVLLNGKELGSIEDFNMALNLIIKAMNNMVR